MKIYKEEIFGPVLGCVRVKDLAAAVELINSHEYGNGVAVMGVSALILPLRLKPATVGRTSVGAAVTGMAAGAGAAPAIGAQA